MVKMSGLWLISFVIVLCYSSVIGGRFDPNTAPKLGIPPKKRLDVEELLIYHGYEGKRYEVTTVDGFILGVTRIMGKQGPPVLMINGMAVGPELWVLYGRGHDLAYILSDMGYDVWIGGQRGLLGSDRHVYLTKEDPAFWNFSHDESGYYDLPAMIDLILSETDHTQLYYVGTSLGGTLLMVMCSERPDYCSSIAGNVQFVPAMWVPKRSQASFLTVTLLHFLEAFVDWLKKAGVYYVGTFPPKYLDLLMNSCNLPLIDNLCFLSLNYISGFNKKNMAPGWLGISVAAAGSGTSTRQLNHLLQLTKSGGVRKYDWGFMKNLEVYGSPIPPSYNISMITSPTGIYYSKQDKLITLPAMEQTIKLMGNLAFARNPADSTYGHSEFVFGKDLYKLVYCDVVDFFDTLSGYNKTWK